MLLRSIRSRLLGLVLATVIPLVAVILGGLGSQLRDDQDEATERVLDEARLLAAQVDNHIGNLENLLLGVSQAVSPRLADTNANDALLRQIKKDLPDYIANILLFAPDGSNIGSSFDADVKRFYAGDRSYFQQVMAGQRLAIGDVIRTKLTGEWVVAVASPVKDQTGRLRAVIAVGTKLDRFQDALRMQSAPGGSVVRVVNQDGIVVAQSDNGPYWIGRDLSGSEDVAQALAAKESSALANLARSGQTYNRIVNRAQRPLARLGRVSDRIWLSRGNEPPQMGRRIYRYFAVDRICHRLDAVGTNCRPITAIAARCARDRGRRSHSPQRSQVRR
jgi:C4-dicarboxylate-specific signal transduction histidine kinase